MQPEYPFYHTYVRNSFAEENAYGARFAQPWAWEHFNASYPSADAARPHTGYRPQPWPEWPAVRDLLPDPYWQNHDDEIACYHKVWELAFNGKRRRATDANRFVSDFNSTAFNDATFMWDSAFIALFGRYGRNAWCFQATLDNFYAKQHPDGFICREIHEVSGQDKFQRHDPSSTGPNVLPWAEWEYFLQTGDTRRLKRVFAPLAAYCRWFRLNRTWPDGSYWGTGWATGMDNQPRLSSEKHAWYEHGHQTWVDTCMQAVLANRILVRMAKAAGREEDGAEFAEEADRLTRWIDLHLWDEQTGFYHDRRADGTLVSHVKTIGAYWALLAEVVPAERLDRLLAHLADPLSFNRAHRVPSLAADTAGYDPDGGYWQGGVWPPTNYMLMRGLQGLDQRELAHAIGCNHLQNVSAAFVSTGTLWENYAPDVNGGGRSAPDFVGWTGVPPVAVLFEQVFGLEPLGPDRLLWDVRLTDAFGVRRYPVGRHGQLDLSCEARTSVEEEPKVRLHATLPLTIELRWAAGQKTINL